ncbi:HigA family addiction module antitoxin [Salinisphaera sp. T31B1]|uniref:HigA family addiction module antitoxin n=1 Tax=Salinisphaera sp. T31B1 TaxID=727963 RepID=UPI0033402BA0
MTELANTHPGDVLLEEFLKPMGLRVSRFADEAGLALDSVNQLIAGQPNLSLDDARRFANYFGTSVSFWVEFQNSFDDEVEAHRKI